MAIYSQLSLAQNVEIATFSQNGYYLSCNTGKSYFYYLSCWKCEALFSRTFSHILLFMVCIFKAVIVIRNYNNDIL